MAGNTPFVLIARIQVKEGMVDECLDLAEAADKVVEASEPGMLFHNFDSDPDDPLGFTWTEVYKNSEALLYHASNPPVMEYMEKQAEISDAISLEIYGEISQEVTEALDALPLPVKHFKTTRVGYIRREYFS